MSLPAVHADRADDLGMTPYAFGIYTLLASRRGYTIGRRHLIRGTGRSVFSEQRLFRTMASVQRGAGRASVRHVPGRGWKLYRAVNG
jgi:hypothetical protein